MVANFLPILSLMKPILRVPILLANKIAKSCLPRSNERLVLYLCSSGTIKAIHEVLFQFSNSDGITLPLKLS